MIYIVLLCKSTSVPMGERQMLAAIVKRKIMRLKGAFVDKTPLSLYWPEKSSSVMIAAVLLHCCCLPPCWLAVLMIWRCCSEVPVLCLSMSSLTHVLSLCVLPSASGGCPSPPWGKKKRIICILAFGEQQHKMLHEGTLIMFSHAVTTIGLLELPETVVQVVEGLLVDRSWWFQ